ncbi:import inner membrane translocase subunit tim-21 [Ophiocordyceps camponoti-floridani]|uniref:Mitochondrial import inner membrane translocase subunit Tim21 n=1 Tax=Ophiocordyceps camponoti-floridani TaxID=2030778 RepID=A0A8H4VD67_9HYPO|nr:import inner membrane translocase subunit tim-21 [Ophiocordyceps camponoti-floridani]
MRPNLLLRTTRLGACSTSFSGLASRTYSSQTGLGAAAAPKQRRQSITPFNDNGSVPWRELSVTEKMARTTQQGFNGGLVAIGLVLTGTVVYFLWTDVFSPDSKISQFNRAVDRIKKDPRCIQLLGEAHRITAHGEETMNKWRRARPLSYSEKVDARGDSHLMMHFYVDGPLQNGVAQLHMVKRQGESDYEYRYFFVDVKGHERVYLEKATSESGPGKKQLSLFGVKWGR